MFISEFKKSSVHRFKEKVGILLTDGTICFAIHHEVRTNAKPFAYLKPCLAAACPIDAYLHKQCVELSKRIVLIHHNTHHLVQAVGNARTILFAYLLARKVGSNHRK